MHAARLFAYAVTACMILSGSVTQASELKFSTEVSQEAKRTKKKEEDVQKKQEKEKNIKKEGQGKEKGQKGKNKKIETFKEEGFSKGNKNAVSPAGRNRHKPEEVSAEL